MESGRHPRHLGAAQWRVGTATFSIQGEGSLCAVGFILFVPFAYQMYRCLELREKVDANFTFLAFLYFKPRIFLPCGTIDDQRADCGHRIPISNLCGECSGPQPLESALPIGAYIFVNIFFCVCAGLYLTWNNLRTSPVSSSH